MINSEFVKFLTKAAAAGIEAPCSGAVVPRSIRPLCAAFVANSLLGPLQNDIDFPVTICHSMEDELVGFKAVVPDLSLDLYPSNIKMYEAPFPILAPTGVHNAAHILCQFAPVSEVFTNTGTGDEANNLIKPLSKSKSNKSNKCGKRTKATKKVKSKKAKKNR
jgi:hypothetical protein